MEELTQEEIIWIKNEKKRYNYGIQIRLLLNDKEILSFGEDDNKETLIAEKTTAIDELKNLMTDLN